MENKTKRPLQVGEKVAIYDCGCRYTGVVEEVDGSGGSQSVYISFGNDDNRWLHPKQCVRLKKKPKPQEKERIRARIEFCEADRALVKCIVFDRLGQQFFDKHTMRAGVTPDGACLTEMREGEFITSKAKLAEAWNATFCSNVQVSNAPDGSYFKELCEKLGG